MENYALVIALHNKRNIQKRSYKIYANIVKNKLYEYYYQGKSGDQNGFQRGRTCADGYCSLNPIVEKHAKFIIKTHRALLILKQLSSKLIGTHT
jgi:hypothetical protein